MGDYPTGTRGVLLRRGTWMVQVVDMLLNLYNTWRLVEDLFYKALSDTKTGGVGMDQMGILGYFDLHNAHFSNVCLSMA